MIKLTYIVCVYNSAATIIRTLESIYRQPIKEYEYEVIVVDDCSPDNSSELVAAFAVGYKNLHLVRQKENHRVGTSMNVGIRLAKGEYIQVVDGDDVVGDGIVDTLNQCLAQKVDVSINTSQYEDADGSLHPMLVPTDLVFPISSKDFCEKVFCTDPIFGGTQFYMWKREFLHEVNHPFVEDLKMEDTDWIEYHLPQAKKIGCSRYMTYTYLYNENSQVHDLSISTMSDFILQCYRRLEVCNIYRDDFPNYTSKIQDASNYRVRSFLRYRNLTKFSCKDYSFLYARLGDEVRQKLATNKYGGFCDIFLRHKYITLAILLSTSWVSRVGRWIVHSIRNNSI